MALIDLKDPTLFGNDAAEDEDEAVFDSYAVARPEVRSFASPEQRLCVARAYKGEGKSALLRLSANQVRQGIEGQVVVSVSATSLAPALKSADFSAWIRAWKSAILQQLAAEVGATIGMAWSDDAIGLVELAEKRGFKARNIVSAILDRLKFGDAEIAGAKVSGLERKRLNMPDPEKTLARWSQDGTGVWLFIDDVDLNFQNTTDQKAKVSSFFVACRELVNTIDGLSIRAAVRPNVWTVIKLEFEALSHVEQYAHDLTWAEEDMRAMLARRVEAYLIRKGRWEQVRKKLPVSKFEHDKALVELVFESPMQWSKTTRPPHVVIYTLSKHRPRWAIELCKEAARSSVSRDKDRISRDDIFSNLAAFGKRRIEDTIAEFRSQCPQIDELISAFQRGPENFQTDQLLKLIENKILNHFVPQIAGVAGKPTSREIAAFLFEIGIFFGRRELPGGAYEHVGFSEQPTLWRSRSDMDRGLSWEVHPIFRQALEIRDAEGREFAPPQRRPLRRSDRPS